MDKSNCRETSGEFHPCIQGQVSTGGWDCSWSLVKQDFCQKLPGLEESRLSADWAQSGSAREAKGSCKIERTRGTGAETKAKRARG